MHAHLTSLSDRERLKTRRDSEAALRLAWPARETYRARIVIDANVTMLRDLRDLQRGA
jgi:hypothetical protein